MYSDGKVRLGETVVEPFDVPLGGARVDQCAIDHALTLRLDESGQLWTVRIEGAFRLIERDGSCDQFGSDNALASAYGPAIDKLLHATIAEASVARDGTLTFLFEEGRRVEIPLEDQWEAWQINGPAGELVVGGPGGEISRWPAEGDAG
jgi:hypothetical protein